VLTEHGRGDLAYRIASQTEYPSWGYWVRQGANTSWETWSHRGSEQTFDHPFLGTVEDWLFQHLAGIQPAEPGYAEILVAPVIPEGLEYASASVTTPRGLVSSSWQRNDRSITVKVQTPAGAPTRVRVPGPAEDVEIVSGEAELVTSSRESSTYRIGTRDIHLRIGGIC
jgi:alpha-L-rhamnosidase